MALTRQEKSLAAAHRRVLRGFVSAACGGKPEKSSWKRWHSGGTNFERRPGSFSSVPPGPLLTSTVTPSLCPYTELLKLCASKISKWIQEHTNQGYKQIRIIPGKHIWGHFYSIFSMPPSVVLGFMGQEVQGRQRESKKIRIN